MKAYVTADHQTQENIVLGHFKQGIDSDARLWVDMREPRTVAEACAIYERYQSNLSNKATSGRGHVRAVHTEVDYGAVTEQIHQLEECVASIAAAHARPSTGSSQVYERQRPSFDLSNKRCFACGDLGHLAATCSSKQRQYPPARNLNQQVIQPQGQNTHHRFPAPEKREASTSTEQSGNYA